MSDRLRFATARQVFEAFPTAAADIEVQPGDDAALDFARKLLAPGRRFEAVVYIAYLLPRREAVWWGCQCVRAISGNKTDDALLSAEAWVREPEETTRRARSSSRLRKARRTVNPSGHRRASKPGYGSRRAATSGCRRRRPPP